MLELFSFHTDRHTLGRGSTDNINATTIVSAQAIAMWDVITNVTFIATTKIPRCLCAIEGHRSDMTGEDVCSRGQGRLISQELGGFCCQR